MGKKRQKEKKNQRIYPSKECSKKQKPKTLNEESQYEKVGNKVRVFTLF